MSPHIHTTADVRALARTRVLVAAVIAAVMLAAAAPVTAHAAYTWSEGGSKKFGGTVGSGLVSAKINSKYALLLDRVKVWEFKGSSPSFDPRTAQRLSNGNTLVADTNGRAVVEYSPSGKVVWRYSSGNDASLAAPYSAQRLSNGHTLITDRGSGSVIEVDSAKRVVWRYGDGTAGLEAGRLVDPVYAQRTGAGNTLIVDSNGGYRVIEVRSSDYDSSQPNNGYSASSIVWRYGTDGVSGVGAGRLAGPMQAQRLSNGHTLIADAGGHRVLQVDPSGSTVWQFGKSGQAGSDMTHLRGPASAQRQTDGTTLIVDRDNARLLKVDSQGKAERIDTTSIRSVGALSSPQTAFVTSKGTTLIADQANKRLIEIGTATSGRYTTDPLDLGTPGVTKQITRIDAFAVQPDKTGVKLQYSVNGGTWRAVGGPSITFPTGLLATSLRVRADLSTSNRYVTPQLNVVQVTYNIVPKSATTGGTNTSGLYGGPLVFGPYSPTTGTSAAAKTAGAAVALPQGSATPGVAQATVYSGFLMQRVTGAGSTKDTKGLGGLPIEAAGTAAALLLLTTVYSVGLASTTLSQATSGALSALKSILTRSV